MRNLPRPLLVANPSSSGSTEADSGLFAVPTTLPPNSRHGKLFLPSKEAELTFRQHLDTISVSEMTEQKMQHGVHMPASRRYHRDSEFIRKYGLLCEAVLLMMLKLNIVLTESNFDYVTVL